MSGPRPTVRILIDGLVEHLEHHLGEIVGEWTTDPEGIELPFRIVHYGGGKAPAGTEVFSTLGLSDYGLGELGVRIELLIIAPAGLTAGTIPPILHHAGVLPIDADDAPDLGDTYTAVEALIEISPMDALYVGRPLYQAAGFNPFDNGSERVVFWWLIPIYDVEADFVEEHGWEAFEQLMWDLDVDPTDFTREPWLE
jgi:hypothetical protein